MRFFMFPIMVVLVLNGCGKQQEEEKTVTVVPPASVSTSPSFTESIPPPSETPVVVPQETLPPSLPVAPADIPPAIPPVIPPAIKVPPKTAPESPAPAAQTDISTVAPDALVLAKQSGCMACHSVEKKLVGPGWKDVSIRYKNDAKAKAMLIAKVKAGGKGNWTEVTGGMAMPPYSPRVSDGNIEILVDFVLSLAH